jgi:hypothetical protein
MRNATEQVYQVQNPFTGATEFPTDPNGRRPYAWAAYCRNNLGHVQHVGWSNADTEAEAIAALERANRDGDEYAVTVAHTATLNEATYYRARRAQLAPTDALRQRWARTLIDAAIDHLNALHTDDVATASARLYRLSVAAVAALGDAYDPQGTRVSQARRIETRADVAARRHRIVTESIVKRRPESAVEHWLTSYLEARDRLMQQLETIAPH